MPLLLLPFSTSFHLLYNSKTLGFVEDLGPSTALETENKTSDEFYHLATGGCVDPGEGFD